MTCIDLIRNYGVTINKQFNFIPHNNEKCRKAHYMCAIIFGPFILEIMFF